MVEADTVERVEQRDATLDLVRFDHPVQEITDGEVAFSGSRQVIRNGKDGAEVVRWVSPWAIPTSGITSIQSILDRISEILTFCSEEAVIEIEPADNGTDVECSTNGVKLVVRPWDFRTCTVHAHSEHMNFVTA